MRFFKISDYVLSFLSIIDTSSIHAPFLLVFNSIAIFFFFSQPLSYIFKVQNEFSDEKLTLFSQIIFYSNFSNILTIFQNQTLTLICYFSLVIFLNSLLVYWVLIGYGFRKFHLMNTLLNNLLLPIFRCLFLIFYWFLLIPSLEIFINPFFCLDSQGFVECRDVFSLPFVIISVFCIGLILFISWAFLFFGRTCNFLDEEGVNFDYKMSYLIVFGMRVVCPLLYPIFKSDFLVLFYLFTFLQYVILGFEYMKNLPFRNRKLNELFICLLFCSLLILILSLCVNYFNLFSFFYQIIILIILMIKFGKNVYFHNYFAILTNPTESTLIYSLEETQTLFFKHFDDKISRFYFFGILKNHEKKCKDPKCRLSKSRLKKFADLSYIQKEHRVHVFIFQGLFTLLSSKNRSEESLVIKYVSFLLKSKASPYKTYFELQKIKKMLGRTSIFQEFALKYQLRKIVEKINDIERTRCMKQMQENAVFSDNIERLDTSLFFLLEEKAERINNEAIELLNLKIKVFEEYKEGVSSYDDILKILGPFFNKANQFKQHLDIIPNKDKNFIFLKYSAFFSCMVFTDLKIASAHEEEISKLKEKYAKADSSTLTPLVFLNQNLVTCKVSFLNKVGKIIQSSKNEKFASFFNYSLSDVQQINIVPDLMPKLIGSCHPKFIDWTLKREWADEIKKKGFKMESFAKEKNGFIFPVSVLTGLDLHNPNDFIMNAGIMKLGHYGEGVLFEKTGAIIGFSEGFYNIFKEKNSHITVEGLESLNIFSVIDGLFDNYNKHFDEDKINDVMIANVNGNIVIPENINEIIELMIMKQKEIAQEKTSEKMYSVKSFTNRTAVSKTSEKSLNAVIVNKFLSKTTVNSNLRSKKDLLVRIFHENNFNGSLFKELYEKCSTIKMRFVFDLKFKSHRFGKRTEDSVNTIWLKIVQFPEEIYEKHEELSINNRTEESLFLSDNPLIMPPDNNVELDVLFEREMISTVNRQRPKISEFNPQISNENKEKVESQKNESHSHRSPREIKKILEKNDSPKNENENSRKSKSSSQRKKGKIAKQLSIQNKKINSSDDHFDENAEKVTAQGSTVSSLKSNFGIFRELLQIQRNLPKEILFANTALFFQGCLLLTYCLFIYFVTTLYVTDTYLPLQEANLVQCQINIGISTLVLLTTQFEYVFRNLTNMNSFYTVNMIDMMNDTFVNIRDLVYNDRKKPIPFDFGNYLETLYSQYVDNGKTSNILFSDLTDRFLQIINDFLITEKKSLMLENLKVIPRNFIYWISASRTLRDQISNEFLVSNGIVTNYLLIFFCTAVAIVFLIKFLEYFIFYRFHIKIQKLLNIFLRMNQNEIDKEIIFHKRIISLFKDPKKPILSESFKEVILSKNDLKIGDTETVISIFTGKKNKTAAKTKKIRKTSRFDIHALSKLRILIYLIIMFSIPFAFYIGTYYYWIMTNNNISILLNINAAVFNKLYTYSTTSLSYNNLLIREKIIRDPEYEIIKETYQNHTNRVKYFYTYAIDRVTKLKGYVSDLPKYGIFDNSFMKDPDYRKLMEGNTCRALASKNYIKNSDQLNFCENVFNKAFQNGIFSVFNEYILFLNSEPFINLKEDNKTIDSIRTFLKTKDSADLVLGNRYISLTLVWFYNFLVDYYLGQIQSQIGSLKSVVWVLSVFCCGVLAALGIYCCKIMKKMYENSCKAIYLLPYEKIIDDEQIIVLIKNYTKENIK